MEEQRRLHLRKEEEKRISLEAEVSSRSGLNVDISDCHRPCHISIDDTLIPLQVAGLRAEAKEREERMGQLEKKLRDATRR